jgi:hypothetical protein
MITLFIHLGYLGKPVIFLNGDSIYETAESVYIEVELMLRGIWYGLKSATRAHAKLFAKDGNYYIIE